MLLLSWPLSSNSRYRSIIDADEAVSVVSLISSSGGYINGRYYANLELLIYKTSSIYLYVKLEALASWILLSFTRFWRNSAIKSDSTHYFFRNASAKSGSLRFSVFRSLTDFVWSYTYEFWLSFCKIVRSSVILLLPLSDILTRIFVSTWKLTFEIS